MERVLAATIEELAGNGYGGLTIPGVAERAGANKTSVYRRWSTKGELVRAALETVTRTEAAPGQGPAPGGSHGGLRENIVTMLKESAKVACSPAGRGAIRALVAHEDQDEVAGIARSLLSGPAATAPMALLEEAKARGELAEGLDPSLVLTVISGAVLQRTMVEGREADAAFLEGLVDLVLRGIEPDRP